MLLNRKPVVSIADQVIRFHHGFDDDLREPESSGEVTLVTLAGMYRRTG